LIARVRGVNDGGDQGVRRKGARSATRPGAGWSVATTRGRVALAACAAPTTLPLKAPIQLAWI